MRPFRAGDIAPYAAIRAKPEVVRFLPGGMALCATAREDAERIVPRFAALWEAGGYGPWAVEDRGSGTLLGHAGLRDLGRETEILYMLDSRAWGQGLATEAALAARDYGFGVLRLPGLVGYALPENAASCRVLAKIGMREEGRVHIFGLDALRFVLTPPAG
nr:GNAT family N-acetyltransferase [Roseococcus sp. MDT2-1-1]